MNFLDVVVKNFTSYIDFILLSKKFCRNENKIKQNLYLFDISSANKKVKKQHKKFLLAGILSTPK